MGIWDIIRVGNNGKESVQATMYHANKAAEYVNRKRKQLPVGSSVSFKIVKRG